MKINFKKMRFGLSGYKMSPRTVILLILLIILFYSVSVYFKSNYQKADRIFFFPDHKSSSPIGESRKTPKIPFEKEENIEIFIKELLLGPISMNLDPIFPTGTRLEKLLYRDKTVYLDLNFMALLPDKRAIHGFDNTMLLIEKNIKFNFPFVEKIIVTILGQKPEIDV